MDKCLMSEFVLIIILEVKWYLSLIDTHFLDIIWLFHLPILVVLKTKTRTHIAYLEMVISLFLDHFVESLGNLKWNN